MKKTIYLLIKRMGINLLSGIIVFSCIILSLILLDGCSKNNDSNSPDKNNGVNSPDKGTSSCKDTPAQLTYGKTTFDLVYNEQGNPVKLTSTKATSIKQPTGVVITAYSIEYDRNDRVSKVSRMTDSKSNGFYVPEYNSNGQMIRLGEYDVPGQHNMYSTASFDNSGHVIKLTTNIDGDKNIQTCDYTYDGANLTKKSIHHFYDPISQQFINSDFTYEYYSDKVKKEKSFFTGLLGLRIMADFADSQSIYFISNAERGQLLFAQEGTASKNILKHIKITAQRYNRTDDTDVDYSYKYDDDGFVNYQKGESHNVIIRSESTPFGGAATVTVPTDNSSAFNIGYFCP